MIQNVKLSLNDERLRWKHAKVAFEMIQLIVECMVVHSAFSKTKLKFKMWFLPHLSIKFLFLTFLGHKNESKTWRNQLTLEIGVWTIRISQNFKGASFCREEHIFKGQIWARPLDEEAPLDQRLRWHIRRLKRCD